MSSPSFGKGTLPGYVQNEVDDDARFRRSAEACRHPKTVTSVGNRVRPSRRGFMNRYRRTAVDLVRRGVSTPRLSGQPVADKWART